MTRKAQLLGTLITGVVALVSLQASIAQDKYPSRPVTFLVPQAAGGANDAIARVIAQKLTETSGQTFLVDNHPTWAGALCIGWQRHDESPDR